LPDEPAVRVVSVALACQRAAPAPDDADDHFFVMTEREQVGGCHPWWPRRQVPASLPLRV